LIFVTLGGLALGFGFGVGLGVATTGFGVGFGVTRGVGAGVTRGVGAGVTRGVGAGVTRGVGAGVTAGVVTGVGAAVRAGVGTGVATGNPVGTGVPPARSAVGEGLDDATGLTSTEGDGLAGSALALAGGSEVEPAGGDVGLGVCGAVVDDGPVVLGGTTAIAPVGRADDVACCWSPTPPMPSAMVASTRFRTPRPRMIRTRWVAVTAMRDS
jgi:hypothetical protein